MKSTSHCIATDIYRLSLMWEAPTIPFINEIYMYNFVVPSVVKEGRLIWELKNI
jgi:hypothetical protein